MSRQRKNISDRIATAREISCAPQSSAGLAAATTGGFDERYVSRLVGERRDTDGRLLRAGTSVIANPVAPEEVKEDTPANRSAFVNGGYAWTSATRARAWFPPEVSDALARDSFSAAEATKQRFLGAIAENLTAARYQIFPQINLPLMIRAMPWEPRIWRVREAADLSSDLSAVLRAATGVPDNVEWPADCAMLVDRLQGAKVFELCGIAARLHVVAAFACPVELRLGELPELRQPNASTIESVRSVYENWRRRHGAPKPVQLFVSVGSYIPWSADVQGLSDGRSWIVCSSPATDGWKTTGPPTVSERLAIRDFADRLRPETRGERTKRIRTFVDRELDEGVERVSTKHVKEKLDRSLRRGAIADAFFALQELKHYRVTRTAEGLLAIDRHVEWKDHCVVRGSLAIRLARRFLATIVLFLGTLATKIVVDVIEGNPLHWWTCVFATSITIALGPFIDKIRANLRERKEVD